ncbi:hypothetical protein HMSSN036_60200 [Paenibacillus macerans]|nr:hypothetical protein HMSSN036_60200 [Paenibacillus macerans]
MTDNLLEIDDLNVSFRTFAGTVRAVRGVSLHLKNGKRWRWWASRGRANP